MPQFRHSSSVLILLINAAGTTPKIILNRLIRRNLIKLIILIEPEYLELSDFHCQREIIDRQQIATRAIWISNFVTPNFFLLIFHILLDFLSSGKRVGTQTAAKVIKRIRFFISQKNKSRITSYLQKKNFSASSVSFYK